MAPLQNRAPGSRPENPMYDKKALSAKNPGKLEQPIKTSLRKASASSLKNPDEIIQSAADRSSQRSKDHILQSLPFWEALSTQEKELLLHGAAIRTYEKNALIYSTDQECLGLVVMLSGEIRAYMLSDEGREVTLFRLFPKDVCVLSASCVINQITFDTQLIAQKDTELLILPAAILASLKEKNVHLRCFLYEQATKSFSDVMWAMQQILFKRLDQRLAAFLLSESDRTGTDTITMTHEQIAQHISSAREAVARMLKQFTEEGLVELRRGTIIIKDAGCLRSLL